MNFQNGAPTKWVIIGGPIASSPESALFYGPIIADPNPAKAGSIFEGSQSVWRTQDWGGNQAFLEANCPEFTTSSANPACGDFVRIGPAGATDLTASNADYRGTTRSGGNVAAIERTASDTGTMWAGDDHGSRLHLEERGRRGRIGDLHAARQQGVGHGLAPAVRLRHLRRSGGREPRVDLVLGLQLQHPEPAGPRVLGPVQPDHGTMRAGRRWTGRRFPDFPATDVVADSNGDVYASTDFGVMKLPSGLNDWEVAGAGTASGRGCGPHDRARRRKLYAATHGRSAWQLRSRNVGGRAVTRKGRPPGGPSHSRSRSSSSARRAVPDLGVAAAGPSRCSCSSVEPGPAGELARDALAPLASVLVAARPSSSSRRGAHAAAPAGSLIVISSAMSSGSDGDDAKHAAVPLSYRPSPARA